MGSAWLTSGNLVMLSIQIGKTSHSGSDELDISVSKAPIVGLDISDATRHKKFR